MPATLPSAKPRVVSKPVRVCFVIDQLGRAGTETQLIALIRALDRARVQPHLCLLNGNDDISRSLEPTNCPTLRLGIQSLLRPASLRAARQLGQFWRRQRIDIVQTYFLDSTYFGALVAKLCGIRRIIRVRNNLGYWMQGAHRYLARLMGKVTDITLTNSASGKQAVMEMDKLAAEKVAVLENGVDLERFPPNAPPDLARSIVRVGAVGNLRPVKNIDGLIRVAALLRGRYGKLRFEVAGEGDQRSDLERLIVDKGVQDIFQLRGSVSDVPGFLARQDIAVLCSHSEGMSNALLEYMAAGRAIVATDVGSNAQLIENGVHGLIVPPRNDEALASAIADLLEHPENAVAMAAAARRRVEVLYSREAMVRRFEDFYEKLLTDR